MNHCIDKSDLVEAAKKALNLDEQSKHIKIFLVGILLLLAAPGWILFILLFFCSWLVTILLSEIAGKRDEICLNDFCFR